MPKNTLSAEQVHSFPLGDVMPAYYPIFLDVRDRRCVVFGGGDIGEEKTARLLAYGAEVVVISPDINDTLHDDVDGRHLTWIRRRYQPGDLEYAFIAIVADTSDGKLNTAVSDEARERNVPLNVADVPNLCTWIAPAVVKRGDVIMAASTGGASPALARWFREQLSGTAKTRPRHEVMEYADLAPLLSQARGELTGLGVKVSADHWQACLTDHLVDLVQAGKLEKAKEMLMAMLLKGVNCNCQEGMCSMLEELAESSIGTEAGGTLSSS